MTGHTEIIQFLTSKGADADPDDARGRGPLHYAALGGCALCMLPVWLHVRSECTSQLMPVLGLSSTLLSNLTMLARGNAGTDLMRCADRGAHAGRHVEAVDLLLARGAWADATDGGDDTPLHLAARGMPPTVDEAGACWSGPEPACSTSPGAWVA
jgi:ankyrin repeat protein